ncbi:SMI1/KNR4 family protein [Micromonospora viridifaciens]|uniref:SMI1/KNR4 family protein n=1 Tax=Micromonospora viridifaciens TaxID=1881 RepID=UPI000B5AFF90|nr:SMI1/KNR4 family protein [Micromonospora viridifaciens]
MNDQLTWIDRIVEVTGWHHEPEGDAGWEQVEAELGVALPSDFKELCRRFVPGSFYAYLDLLRPTGAHESRQLLAAWALCRRESFASVYARTRSTDRTGDRG